jgi:hypothetical protein
VSSQKPEANASKAGRSHMQFGLRTMFVLTACVAFACTVLFAVPDPVAVPLLLALTIGVPAVLTTFIVYGGSYLRTFCIGALFPAAIALYASGWFLGYWLLATADGYADWGEFTTEDFGGVYRWYGGTSWLLAIVVGLICVGARWLVAGKKKPR